MSQPFRLRQAITDLRQTKGQAEGSQPRSRQTEEPLVLTEQEYDRFFTLSLDLLCIAGSDGYFKRVNPAFEQTLGYSQAELLSSPFLEFVHPEDQRITLVAAERLSLGEPMINFENRYRCRDGSYKWLAWTTVPFLEEGLLYGVARDVTARKLAKQRLVKQAELLKQQAELLELAYEAIFVRDAQGVITYWNRGAESMYGWTRTEAIGHVTHSFLQTQFVNADIRDLDALVLHQEHWQGELIHTCKDGRQIVVESRQVLIRQHGIPSGFLEVNRDITDRLQVEAARQQSEAAIRQLNTTLEQRVERRTAQLTKVNEELEAFSYTIAHDLRAPIRGIQGFAQALLEDYGDQLDDLGQSYIQKIFDGTDRMNALVQDLLAYSRLSREEIKLMPVQLSQVVTAAERQLEADLSAGAVDLTVIDPLPKVMGHYPILVQVVANLLSNALKFVAKERQTQIRVWAEETAGWVRLWVEDNGIGIEPQYQEQIFGVFERLHSRNAYPGTGIGLAIVRKGVERLGGRAGVESTPGQGSRFWIQLQGIQP